MLEGFGEIKLISRNDISEDKWSYLVTNSEYSIFSSIWYLDIVTPGWKAFILNDYELALPVQMKNKFGFTYSLNPLLIRSFEILGESNEYKSKFLNSILSKFDFFALNFTNTTETDSFIGTKEIRKFQYLKFEETYAKTFSFYSENTKRKIKQFEQSHAKIEEVFEVEQLSELFKKEKGYKFKQFNDETYQKINKLVELGQKLKKGFLIGVRYNDEIIAMGFFVLQDNHLLYVKGVVTESGKKIGAMQGVFNYVISTFHENAKGLDFGGSHEIGLANFNKRFGADDRDYFVLKQNKMKLPFRKIINRKIGL